MADQLYGYVGKIARINLTDSTVAIIPTSDYVPEYIGGRLVCNKIHWDLVKPGTKAFDPENALVYMTGATTATGIPTGGRSVFTGISPNCYPEQYTWSGIGGFFSAELKFAGYDGFILEGKAPEHTYLFIYDDKIEFLPADELWGMKVHETQKKLEELHGKRVKSMVIGPAGENLMRNATITTSNDSVAAKGGFGAVFGSKNLKAVSVIGTGAVYPADLPRLFELRMKMGSPPMRPIPVENMPTHGMWGNEIPVEGGWLRAQTACSYGCNQHCNRLMMNMKSAFSDEKVNLVEKCVSIFAYGYQEDCSWNPIQNFETKYNHFLPCKMLSMDGAEPDFSDPHAPELFKTQPGDIVDFWKPDFGKGSVMSDMCNQYGIDKWDVIIWYMTWLSMCKKEGLLEDMDFGMEVDVENEEFIKYFLDMITYRKGKYGEIFAEGMARAVRTLGKDKFGDSIYHGRISQITGEQLDLPVSLEAGWGHSVHWLGRGFEGSIYKPGWLAHALEMMTSTRDMMTIAHFHDDFDNYLEYKDDPCHSDKLVEMVIYNENMGQLKDTVTTCEWQSPDLYWPDMEEQMFRAATGLDVSQEDLNYAAEQSGLLFRAILIRDFDRTREMEVAEMFPILSYPDSHGEAVTWEEWNDLADLYYEHKGWDKKTGWPTRECYEKYGLGYVADELEKLGKLPS